MKKENLTLKYTFAIALTLMVLKPVFAEDVSFNRDVRPILSDKCFSCHGFDPKTRKANLRLDTVEGATTKIKSGHAIVPGDLKKSEAWSRITSEEKGEVMPPPKSNKTLTKIEKEILRNWIEQGARYDQHWSFVHLKTTKAPTVKNVSWPRNDLDRFILSRLEKETIPPSAQATKETCLLYTSPSPRDS